MISHVIFCENVRKEQGNATTYIGAFGPYIKIPQEQGEFAFRQLCIVSLLTFEEHENIPQQLFIEIEGKLIDPQTMTVKIVNTSNNKKDGYREQIQAVAMVENVKIDLSNSISVSYYEKEDKSDKKLIGNLSFIPFNALD